MTSLKPNLSIVDMQIKDIRFPTSLNSDGSDAVHKNPDYSCAYVILLTEDPKFSGHGFTFTIGKGTEIVVKAIESMSYMVKLMKLADIVNNFGSFYKELTNESQLRWLGPEKGVIHLATAAIVNALWDLWAKVENKPLWKLLVDLEPEQIIKLIDFRYITDAMTESEAIEILRQNYSGKAERENYILQNGLPAYITSVGWMGYTDTKIAQLCQEALKNGWTSFKMKVGCEHEDDMRRAGLLRKLIGDSNKLMMDANQVWEVDEAIDKMSKLSVYKPFWIEEPTSPDDVLGHQKISRALKKYKIGVATGEHCQNRILFKQFMQTDAFQFCQIDACRVGGVNEILAILLLAAKYKIPICPHAGGVGLCELVVHLSAFNFVCVSPSLENVMIEYSDHLHEHFVAPVTIKNARYIPSLVPGYSSELKKEALKAFSFPSGPVWTNLLKGK